MSDSMNPGTFAMLLSHEELAYLLGLVGAQPVLGTDGNPLSGLEPEQAALALSVAGHGLRARRLVQEGDGGQPAVQDNLLAVVNTCGFPERLATAYHWDPGEELPTACYGYVRGARVVLHQRPHPLLHEFRTLGSTAALISQLVSFCALEAAPTANADTLTIPVGVLAAMREHAQRGDAAAALALLPDRETRSATAPFVEALAGTPGASVLTTLCQGNAGEPERREYTVVQSASAAWLLTTSDNNAGLMNVRPVGAAAVEALLADALASAA